MWKSSTLLQTALITTAAALIGTIQAQHHILPSGGEIWAVLIAGSNTWGNYRHQADICHAYQILRGNGIPEKNIIVMMYDDIAHNELNPYPGVIYNRPGGPNVYENVKKDYTGKDVNKKVFFDVLLGNKEGVKGIGTERVLESGPKDHVFINYADHGDWGLLYMPGFKPVNATELLDTFEKMENSSRFHKMFFYVEACHSGSVGEVINSSKIFTMTAANPGEPSHLCFTSGYKKLYAALGDEFSVRWMQDAETVDLRKETVQQEFIKVKSKVKKNHVSEYGNLELGNTKLSEVLGYREQPLSYDFDCSDRVPQHEAPIVILERRIQAAVEQEEKKMLQKQLEDLRQVRKDIVTFFLKLAGEFVAPEKIYIVRETKTAKLTKTNLRCYESAVTQLHEKCFKINKDAFVGTQLHILINLCDLVPEAKLVEKIQTMCYKNPIRQGEY